MSESRPTACIAYFVSRVWAQAFFEVRNTQYHYRHLAGSMIPSFDLVSPSGNRQSAIRRYRRRYETELFENVLPFWTTHSPDPDHGGYLNCLDRTGAPYDTTKYSWLQGRQAWLFSVLYREVETRDDWLALARSGITFLRDNALRPNGQVFFSLTREGAPVYQQRKIFSECFYVMALAAYARAADRPALLDEAETELERIWDWAYDWSKVGRPVHEGQPEAQQLAVPMILLNLIEVVAGDDADRYAAEVDDCIRRVRRHVDRDAELVLETVRPDGSRLAGSDGRLLTPGHAIEAGWFLQHWARRLDRPDLSALATNMVRWSFETGWDDEHGGGFGYLDREGRPTHEQKGAPYKGCFHVPRGLLLCWQLLRTLETTDPGPAEGGASAR